MDRVSVGEIVEGLQGAMEPSLMLEAVVTDSLDSIGRGWARGEIALSQVYMSGRICEEIVDRMVPSRNSEPVGGPRMAIAVLEDHHLLGKRIVYSWLRASGYEPKDYGSISASDLVGRVREDNIEVLLISALMLSSALKVKQVVDGVRELPEKVVIVVGGAPFRFDRRLWLEVGADATGDTASDAVRIVRDLHGGRP